MRKYKPEEDHPIGEWAFLRRPGVPNAPKDGARATWQYLVGLFVILVIFPLAIWGGFQIAGA
jgi:hypothetical protein